MAADFHDFFSGCGGTSLGMQLAGMAVRFALDIDPDAKETYKANFEKSKFICKDIRHVSVDDVAPYIKRRWNRPIVFGACAPCQPFSKQNRNKSNDDERRDLLSEFHRFVEFFQPEYIFFENVPEPKTIDQHDWPFGEFIQLLVGLGYYCDFKIVIAYHYGVPQRRRRYVGLASLFGPINIPQPTHGPEAKNPNFPVVWEFISHLPPIEAGTEHAEIPNHRAARLSPLNQRRIAATPMGGNRRDWPKELELSCHQKHKGYTDVYGRMLKDRPSAALTTRCISLSNGRFGHPTQNRAISVREAACLQTFPMDFKFRGNLNSMARQVGNAVPVAMAQVFGELIIKHYKHHKKLKAA